MNAANECLNLFNSILCCYARFTYAQSMNVLLIQQYHSNTRDDLIDVLRAASSSLGYVHILIETHLEEPVEQVNQELFIYFFDDIIVDDHTWRPCAWMIWVGSETRSGDHFVVIRRNQDKLVLYDDTKKSKMTMSSNINETLRHFLGSNKRVTAVFYRSTLLDP